MPSLTNDHVARMGRNVLLFSILLGCPLPGVVSRLSYPRISHSRLSAATPYLIHCASQRKSAHSQDYSHWPQLTRHSTPESAARVGEVDGIRVAVVTILGPAREARLPGGVSGSWPLRYKHSTHAFTPDHID